MFICLRVSLSRMVVGLYLLSGLLVEMKDESLDFKKCSLKKEMLASDRIHTLGTPLILCWPVYV